MSKHVEHLGDRTCMYFTNKPTFLIFFFIFADKSLHSKENDDNNREGINQSDGTDQSK